MQRSGDETRGAGVLQGAAVSSNWHAIAQCGALSWQSPIMGAMQHMLAGATAGMAEHTAMYPVDTIKTRMQALAHPGQQARTLLVMDAPYSS